MFGRQARRWLRYSIGIMHVSQTLASIAFVRYYLIIPNFKKIDGNGRNTCDALDPSIRSKRKQEEKEWMLKLRTIFPYGFVFLEYTKFFT